MYRWFGMPCCSCNIIVMCLWRPMLWHPVLGIVIAVNYLRYTTIHNAISFMCLTSPEQNGLQLQTTFWDAFSGQKMFLFWFRFYHPRPVLAFGCCCLHLCVCQSVCQSLACPRDNSGPVQVGSQNLDQRCKKTWLRSLLFCGAIDLDLQGQI